jgi:hypothetical protein
MASPSDVGISRWPSRRSGRERADDDHRSAGRDPRRRRIWVQHVDAELEGLLIRIDVLRAPGTLTPAQEAAAQGVGRLIDRAQKAANRVDPYPSRLMNWWRGTLVEAAYRNLHEARAQMVDLYDAHELNAEIPSVVSRVHSTMHLSDPRRVSTADLQSLSAADQRAWLRRLISDSYDALDMKYSRLRNFRNVILSAAFVLAMLTGLTVLLMWFRPSFISLCFPAGETGLLNCPSQAGADAPSGWDVIVVALLGLLGGALATSVAIRKIEGAGTPYDVPVALAWLKIPLGAFVAILGLLGVRGGFVPGLSQLDTQDQILAYALLFGFSQQLFTGVLDNKALSLVADLPTTEHGMETRVISETHATGSAFPPRSPEQRTPPDAPEGVKPSPA